MGDLIEFTTLPNHQLRFYKISSGALAFSVKGERQFRQMQSAERLRRDPKAPGETCDYWIVIKPNQCWIEKEGTCVGNIRKVPNIITGNEYNKFWISWYKTWLQFGRTSDGIPLISKRMLMQAIHYVTFTILGDRGTMQWKLYLPPKLENPVLKNVTGGDMQWVEVKPNGQLPDEALIGGYENEILYIIRAKHRRSLVPGKYVPSLRVGYISWINMPEKKKLEVLCGYSCIWVPTHNREIPPGAVEGGYDEHNNEKLYIGRAFVRDNLIPGKVQISQIACMVPYDLADIPKHKYEILVNPLVYANSSLLPLTLQMSRNLIKLCGVWELDQAEDEHSSDSEV